MNIIFDLDGTLFQTRLCIVGAVDKLFKEKGWEQIPTERITRNIGKTSDQFLAGILPEGVEWHEVYDEFSVYERREIEEKAQLFEGTEELLSSLTGEGHRLYICSTGSEEYIRLVLEKTGILRLFDKTVSAKHTTKTEAVSRLLDEEGFAIVIGDTQTDFDAATDNSIPSIGVTYGYGDEENRKKATFLAGNTKEIAAYIKQIEVFSVLDERIVEGKKRTVGINGVDTSGKSTFAVNFAYFLKSVGRKAAVLHIDDFHNPREIRLSGADEIHAYYDNAFNYQWQHEPVLFGWKRKGKHQWYTGRKESTIWEFDKPKKNGNHPTMKPIPLVAYPIANSSMTNSIVLDPFGGSGSTLIACEQTGRICCTCELDEKFCDVIVKRYIEQVGTSSGVSLMRDGVSYTYEEVTANEQA